MPYSDSARKREHDKARHQVRKRSPSYKRAHREAVHRHINQHRERWNAKKLTSLRARLYGVSKDDVEHMLIGQDGRCAVCAKPFGELTEPHVDHNHDTNKVRGLLCARCNNRVVAVLDDVEMYQEALAYLRRTDPEHKLFQVSES